MRQSMAREAIIHSSQESTEEDYSLRPTRMQDMVGQRKVYERIQGTWLPRLVGNAFAVAVMTRLHEADAAGQMLLNEGWAWLVQRVSEDYQSIQSEIVLPGWRGDKLPTWDREKVRMVA